MLHHVEGVNTPTPLLRVELINNGIGPAVIKCFEVYLDGSLIEGSTSEVMDNFVGQVFPESLGFYYESEASYLGEGYVMSEKERKVLIAIRFVEGSRLPSDINELFNRTDLKIIYQSIYNEEFVYLSDGLE